jgi:uncharacterized membrane protein
MKYPPWVQRAANILGRVFFRRGNSSDLKFITAWVVTTIGVIYIPLLNQSPIRLIFVVPTILFIPGYVLVAALIPGNRGIDPVERVALSFGLSIAIVPLIGFVLSLNARGIDLDSIVFSVGSITFFFTLVAYIRRKALHVPEQFSPSLGAASTRMARELFPESPGRIDRILSLLLLAAIITAIGSTIYVIAIPDEGERFTDFFLLGEKGAAADYPLDVVSGKNYSISIGIGDHEHRTVSYMVEIWSMVSIHDEFTNTSQILAMDLLDRFPVTVKHNETVIIPYKLSVKKPVYNQIEFLLFNESIPGDSLMGSGRINASYRNLHLWITMRS